MGGATWKIIEMKKNVFFPTGNDISQLFKVSAKKFKKKGLIVHTLLTAWVAKPLGISETTGSMAKNVFDLSHSVCNLQNKNYEKPNFGNLTYRHQNFAKFCTDIHFDIKKKPWKFRIDISKIGNFTEQSVKCRKSWSVKYRTVQIIRTRSRDFTKFTRWCHVIHI